MNLPKSAIYPRSNGWHWAVYDLDGITPWRKGIASTRYEADREVSLATQAWIEARIKAKAD